MLWGHAQVFLLKLKSSFLPEAPQQLLAPISPSPRIPCFVLPTAGPGFNPSRQQESRHHTALGPLEAAVCCRTGAPCWGMVLVLAPRSRAHGSELPPSPPCAVHGPAWPWCTAGRHSLSPAPPAFPSDVVFRLKNSTVNLSLESEEKQTGTFGGAPSAKDKAGCCQGHRQEDIHLHSSPSPSSPSRRESSCFRLHVFKG